MFKRSFASKDRAGKATKSSKRLSFGHQAKQKLVEALEDGSYGPRHNAPFELGKGLPPHPTNASSAIVTLVVGSAQRLFAAHEDVLCRSPYFVQACRDLFFAGPGKRIDLSGEDPETFSCVLEYLYRGDYSPRLVQSKNRGWYLEGGFAAATEDAAAIHTFPRSFSNKTFPSAGGGQPHRQPPTLHHTTSGAMILRDTAVYCAAGHYRLPELQRLALRKQGLQSGVDVGTILRSMRFAYAHTPSNDSRLRAHFLALVVRARKTFVRSGTMQMEMQRGGEMFFDLFVALCNHLDDVSDGANTSPRTV